MVDERARHDLYARLEQVLGEGQATTLMAYLPPVGWSDVVTNASLDLRLREFDHRFDAIDHRFEGIDHRFEAVDHKLEAVEQRINARMDERLAHQTRFFITSMLTANASLTALVFAIVKVA